MKFTTYNQRGVGILGVLAVIVVLAGIGSTGWYVYKSNQDTEKTLAQTEDSSQSTAAPSSKPKADSAAETDTAPVKTTFSKVPKALQDVIVSYTTAKAPTCVKDGALVDMDGKSADPDVSYTISGKTGSAFTSVGCDGGSMTLFAKGDSGKWQQVAASQLGFECQTLQLNKVPVKLMEVAFAGQDAAAQCLDEQSQGLVPYKG